MSENRHDILRAQPLGALDQPLVALDDHLRMAVAIADVEKDQRAEIAHAMHPAKQDDAGADVGGAQGAASVSASE